MADILYGKISPSAKLAVSYPNTEVYEPLCYNYGDTAKAKVQWPFGYGLSYSKFDYKNLQVNKEASTDDEAVNISFEVSNTGNVEADEIAQIYLSPTQESQQIRPIQLQGFARVSLNPGQTKTVKTKIYTEQFGFYSNQGKRQWNILPGDFIIKIGASSVDIRLQNKISLKGDAVTKPLRQFYFSESSVQ